MEVSVLCLGDSFAQQKAVIELDDKWRQIPCIFQCWNVRGPADCDGSQK
jgi:hypothetical protein